MTGLLGIIASSVFLILTPAEQSGLVECGVDEAALETYLAMDVNAFDQDFTGGWREVSYRDGCGAGAAVLIDTYIRFSRTPPETGLGTMRWHAGQVLAGVGRTDKALAYFRATYSGEAGSSKDAWDIYVDATIAFLEQDKAALIAARESLSELVPSEEEMASRRAFLEQNPNIQMPEGFVTEPQNMSAVTNLLDCFGRPYADAYPRCTQSD